MKTLLLCCVVLSATAVAQNDAQLKRMMTGKEAAKPDEMVSFRADIPYGEAIKSLDEISKRLTGKMVVDNSPSTNREKAIGVNIEAMYWKDALELILRNNQLWYTEYTEYFEVLTLAELTRRQQEAESTKQVSQKPETASQTQPIQQSAFQPNQTLMVPKEVKVDSGEIYGRIPEVIISSIFIELNQSRLREKGFSLSIFRGKDANIGITFAGSERVARSIVGIDVRPSSKNLTVDLETALKLFESEDLGEVIARPQTIVRSGASGFLQSGQDFSIKQKDFAGNVTDQFVSTGIILRVRPRVFKVNGIDFIEVSYSLERSSASPGAVSSIINKTQGSGILNLLNGEEGYVAGLYTNEETTIREGIPFLKDLPWWFLGLRYLFGFDSYSVTKKELVMVLKAEMVPVIEDRAASRVVKNVMQDRLDEMQKDLERRQKSVKKQ